MLLAIAILLAIVFMSALSALFYVLSNLTLTETEKLNRNGTVLATIVSFVKVFVISLIGFSFFIYSTSFLLRIETGIFKQRTSEQAIERVALPEKELPVSQAENPDPPLFDILIQSAARQNEERQLTFIFATGSVFGLLTILAMAIYTIYGVRSKKD